MSAPLLSVEGVERRFGGRASWLDRLTGRPRSAVQALRGVDFELWAGETLGVLGESGCGKTTLARVVAGLERADAGLVRLDGKRIDDGRAPDGQPIATAIQYVFQDSASALNPRKTVGESLAAPLVHLQRMKRAERERRLHELSESVGLDPGMLSRYPHELSGGQAQRVGIARALAAEPRLILLDEPVSALDVSVQAQVLNLLSDLQSALDLTYIIISHDLSVVERIATRVAVMYFGRIVELGPAERIFRAPQHPYTRLLIDAAPGLAKGGLVDEGDGSDEPPDPYAPPSGCAYAPRCPLASGRCTAKPPELQTVAGSSEAVVCHHPLN